ncbi:PfkB family carbohydrate kinase [Alphaproteobacteria bacterium LSUCC0226]
MKLKKTVLISGNFNALHPGHIRLINFASTIADEVMVGVFSDKVAGTAVNIDQKSRIEAVSSLSSVDRVLLIDCEIKDFIRRHQPHFIVKGKEYENQPNVEIDVLNEYGGQLIFNSGDNTISCLNYHPQKPEIPTERINELEEFMSKHHFNRSDLLQIINQFSSKKVCVIGDVIVDEYIDCLPLGMSQEEPTVVVSPRKRERFIGGAGIVASHAAQLGAKVNLISVSGRDEARDFVATALDEYGVNYSLLVDIARPTTVKQRFRSEGRSLLKVSNLSQKAISNKQQDIIIERFEEMVSKLDLLIFSDFNYGVLPQRLVKAIVLVAKQNNVLISADSQTSSQTGDISRFQGVNLITPTELEARVALKNQDDGIVVLADKLMKKTNADNIILKLGPEGFIAQIAAGFNFTPHTERLKALNANPQDVSGAGDSLLTIASLGMACGATLWQASVLGSVAAFIQVGRVGNTPINIETLRGSLGVS